MMDKILWDWFSGTWSIPYMIIASPKCMEDHVVTSRVLEWYTIDSDAIENFL